MAATDYTFGVEIECFIPTALYNALGGHLISYRLPSAVPGHQFTVKTDGSLRTTKRGYHAVEFVSNILQGRDGLDAVIAFIDWLNTAEAIVNPTCGLHIHVGFATENTDALRRLIRYMGQHERAMFATTGSKAREQNYFCRPVADRYRAIKDDASLGKVRNVATKYTSLNVNHLAHGTKPTVEFRLFAPTLNKIKVIGHIYTAIGMVEKACESTKKNPAYDRTKPPTNGVDSVERMMRCLWWTRKAGLGVIDPAHVFYIKKEFRRLAKKYDACES